MLVPPLGAGTCTMSALDPPFDAPFGTAAPRLTRSLTEPARLLGSSFVKEQESFPPSGSLSVTLSECGFVPRFSDTPQRSGTWAVCAPPPAPLALSRSKTLGDVPCTSARVSSMVQDQSQLARTSPLYRVVPATLHTASRAPWTASPASWSCQRGRSLYRRLSQVFHGASISSSPCFAFEHTMIPHPFCGGTSANSSELPAPAAALPIKVENWQAVGQRVAMIFQGDVDEASSSVSSSSRVGHGIVVPLALRMPQSLARPNSPIKTENWHAVGQRLARIFQDDGCDDAC